MLYKDVPHADFVDVSILNKITMRHIPYTELSQLPVCDSKGRQPPQLYNKMLSLIRQFAYGGDSWKFGLGAIFLNKLPPRVQSTMICYPKSNIKLGNRWLMATLGRLIKS